MADMEHAYVECSCRSSEHVLRFTFDPDTGDLWVEVQLRQFRNFWQRLYMAIRYVLGHKSRYGYYDCTALDPSEFDRLRDLFDRSERATADFNDRINGSVAQSQRTKA